MDLGTTTDAATVSTTASDYQIQLGAAQSTSGDIGRNISFGASGVTTAAINSDGGTSNAQSLGFYTGNATSLSERMRITSGGTVAVNTTSPDSTVDLHVNGGTDNVPLGVESTDSNVFIAFKDSSTTGTFGSAAVAVGANSDNLLFRAGSTEVGRFTSAGNFGINRTSPNGLLHMQSSSGTDSAFYIQTSAATDDSVINFGDDSSSTVGKILYAHSDNSMRFNINSSERARIDSSGNIGISTTSPDKLLHLKTAVNNTAVMRIESTATNSYPHLEFKNDARTFGIYGAHGGLSDAFSIYDGTLGAHRLTIDTSGDVGINTTSPNLHGWAKAVTLDTATNAGYELGQSGTKYGAFALQGDGRVQLTNFTSNPLTFQTNNTERARIDSSGRFGMAQLRQIIR